MDANVDRLQSLLSQSVDTEELFAQARSVRASHFGNEIFAYGFNYFSTYCKNQCSFCHYRSSNSEAPRYRNDPTQVIEDAKRLADSGTHLIDLTMGEDPYYAQYPEAFAELISGVHEATQLPVMISPGMVEPAQLRLFKQAGAVWFALYQETFDRSAYARLRIGQNFDKRLALKSEAIASGLLVEEGIMTGWGDSASSAVQSLLQMGTSFPSQVRTMTFVPQKGTPLETHVAEDSSRELVMIALMRLLYPGKLIPASLDVEGPQGLRARLDAGANVVTSLIPPHSGLAGVARKTDIEDGGRSLPQIMPLIEEAGLTLAPQASYEAYIKAAFDEHQSFGRVATDQYLAHEQQQAQSPRVR